MQTAVSSNSRNTVSAIAAIMREHPGMSAKEIRQIGGFTLRQMETYGEQAAELADQQSRDRN